MVPKHSNANRGGSGNRVWIALLLLSNLLLLVQLTYVYTNFALQQQQPIPDDPSSAYSPPGGMHHASLSQSFSLDIPKGRAVALPSVLIKENTTVERSARGVAENVVYGGVGDKPHLGGFTSYDGHGVSPQVWKYMVRTLGVKSILDVGCGRGISTWWFVSHGLRTTCVEGSHDAVLKTILPEPHADKVVVEHDFSRGPWWPSTTVDAVWCVEFLEHVSRQYIDNYIQSFRKAALIFATHSSWGGWHHVEVHRHEWWINKFEMLGFRYSEHLTKSIRNAALEEHRAKQLDPNGKQFYAQHVIHNMQVFINPVVAALPQHAHLLADHGCYDVKKANPGNIVNRECGTGKGGDKETKLEQSFYPLELNETMDKEWFDLVKRSINTSTT